MKTELENCTCVLWRISFGEKHRDSINRIRSCFGILMQRSGRWREGSRVTGRAFISGLALYRANLNGYAERHTQIEILFWKLSRLLWCQKTWWDAIVVFGRARYSYALKLVRYSKVGRKVDLSPLKPREGKVAFGRGKVAKPCGDERSVLDTLKLEMPRALKKRLLVEVYRGLLNQQRVTSGLKPRSLVSMI